jgi:hypothetical protein
MSAVVKFSGFLIQKIDHNQLSIFPWNLHNQHKSYFAAIILISLLILASRMFAAKIWNLLWLFVNQTFPLNRKIWNVGDKTDCVYLSDWLLALIAACSRLRQVGMVASNCCLFRVHYVMLPNKPCQTFDRYPMRIIFQALWRGLEHRPECQNKLKRIYVIIFRVIRSRAAFTFQLPPSKVNNDKYKYCS